MTIHCPLGFAPERPIRKPTKTNMNPTSNEEEDGGLWEFFKRVWNKVSVSSFVKSQRFLANQYLLSFLLCTVHLIKAVLAVDKSRGDIKKEKLISWKRPDRDSNPGPPGDRQERYQLYYAAPPPPTNTSLSDLN